MSIYEASLRDQIGIPYIYGGSDETGLDCSGSVCFALSKYLGYKVRVNADTLSRKFFTPCVSKGPMALFFYDEDGKAYHTSGYAGNGYFLNMSRLDGKEGRLRTLEELGKLYGRSSLMYLRRDLCV